MGPYMSLCFSVNCNGFLCVLLCSYASLKMLLGTYKSLCDLMGPLGRYASLSIPIDPNGSLYNSYATLSVPLGPI